MYLKNLNRNSIVVLSEEDNDIFSYAPVWRQRFEKILRENAYALVDVFRTWGFKDYYQFKTIVIHFYPEVKENELRELYTGTVIRQDVLKYVDYTYQILNV
jgi:hypothetical protein